jgi:dephospho-CoA kinase
MPSISLQKTLILGLTGSVGSGKTFVSSLFSACNARIISADAVAHEVVGPGSPALTEIAEIFGAEVLLPDGTLNRPKLAEIVFSDRPNRQKLEEIVHPRVRTRELQLIEEYRHEPLVVLDVPLLFETSFHKDCDRTLVVLVTEEERTRRLQEGRGMTREQIQARLRNQMPQWKKAQLSDFLLDNSSTRQYTCIQVKRILSRLFPGGLPEPLKELATP